MKKDYYETSLQLQREQHKKALADLKNTVEKQKQELELATKEMYSWRAKYNNLNNQIQEKPF